MEYDGDGIENYFCDMHVLKKAEFFSLLKHHGFSDEDQGFWWPRIQAAPEESRQYIIEFLTTISGGAEWLRMIQERKEQALFTGDRNAWEDVLKNEEAIIPA